MKILLALKYILLGFIFFIFWNKAISQDKNEEIIQKVFSLADATDSIPTIVDKIGHFFLGKPYVANTLESEKEHLVINLGEFDCTTFVENVVGFSGTIRKNKKSAENFYNYLQNIRYRDGVLNEYPSRLHYFTEWLANNEKKGILKNITKDIGGEVYPKKINFMSKHHDKYPQLSNLQFLQTIVDVEKKLNKNTFYYVPKENVINAAKKLRTGDIIAFTTSIEGLDVVHVGFAYEQANEIKLLHASNGNKKEVLITEEPLEEYLANKKWITGIMAARLLE